MPHSRSIHSFPVRRALRVALLVTLAAVVAEAPPLPGATQPAPGPRGQPIRPAPANAPAATVVTLPGGIVITNLPAGVLPRSATNTIRLPTTAARKFEPLGYQPTSFTVLARYFLEAPGPDPGVAATPATRWENVRKQIPADVLSLDGRKVALAGFVLPLALQEGRTTRFLLLRTQSACCFGLMPRVNEIVVVDVPLPGVQPRPDTPFVVAGVFRLKWIGEGDQLTAIYQMDGEKIEPAPGF
jgi:hypothetical protein